MLTRACNGLGTLAAAEPTGYIELDIVWVRYTALGVSLATTERPRVLGLVSFPPPPQPVSTCWAHFNMPLPHVSMRTLEGRRAGE